MNKYNITLDVKEMACLLPMVMADQKYFKEKDNVGLDEMEEAFIVTDILNKLTAAIQEVGNEGELIATINHLRPDIRP